MSDQEERSAVDVYEFLAHQIDMLSGIAWAKMGLRPDMMTGKIEMDMDQAKPAVDAVAALAAILDPNLDEADRRQIQNIVRDLRVNYVEKASGQ